MFTTVHDPLTGAGQDPNRYVGAWVEPAGTMVKVTCAISGPRPLAPFTEDDFHRRFRQALSYLVAGQPLPVAPPAAESSTDR
jgi:hypothetical protein